MDLAQILAKAKWGTLTPSELANIASSIGAAPPYDQYTMLHAIGRAGATKYEPLVAQFLREHRDPGISGLALRILCNWWGLTDRYFEDLVSFLNGQNWDVSDEAQLMAISIAGEYLRNTSNLTILETLFHIFSDISKRNVIRGSAYFALCRAEGRDWDEIPPASRSVDFLRDIDAKVIASVQAKLFGS